MRNKKPRKDTTEENGTVGDQHESKVSESTAPTVGQPQRREEKENNGRPLLTGLGPVGLEGGFSHPFQHGMELLSDKRQMRGSAARLSVPQRASPPRQGPSKSPRSREVMTANGGIPGSGICSLELLVLFSWFLIRCRTPLVHSKRCAMVAIWVNCRGEEFAADRRRGSWVHFQTTVDAPSPVDDPGSCIFGMQW